MAIQVRVRRRMHYALSISILLRYLKPVWQRNYEDDWGEKWQGLLEVYRMARRIMTARLINS